MQTKAIIVGIDAYTHHPLTSAVNDARELRDALAGCGLVEMHDVTLLTNPVCAEATGVATHRAITKALYEIYVSGNRYDRFFFSFSGHGLLAFSNAQQTRTRTALVSAEVDDLDRDGAYLIDFSELLDVMALAGPREQFYFIDACRDMSYTRQPGVAGLGWAATPVMLQRAQRCIYAVSPLGRAKAIRGEMGIFTCELVRALRDPVLALHFDFPSNRYVVTMESLHEFVSMRVGERIRGEPLATKKYNLPTPFTIGPTPEPLQIVLDPPNMPFTVHIDPAAAEHATTVVLERGGDALPDECCYPRRKNHETILLKPQWHHLRASSSLGPVDPSDCMVDVRRERERTIRVGGSPLAPPPPEALPAPPTVTSSPAPGNSSVEARALDPESEITLLSLQAPYEKWSSRGMLSESVPPGPYRVEFRLGPDVFNADNVFVARDSKLALSATADMSPLLREVLHEPIATPPSIAVSESIGPLQSALLPTFLPMIGIKPFDLRDELFEMLAPLRRIPPSYFNERPLSVVLAVDGNEWSEPIERMLSGASCNIVTARGNVLPVPLARLPIEPDASAPSQSGVARIRLGLAQAPAEPFYVHFGVPEFDDLHVASASLFKRATVVTLLLRPDGSFEASQNLFRLPGENYPNEPPAPPGNLISYGASLRRTQLAQKLYQTGELLSTVDCSALGWFLKELLYGKWVDPLLGCMGYYAARRLEPTDPMLPSQLRATAAQNLSTYFRDLPDARIVAACEAWDGRNENHGFDEFLNGQQMPILAESVYRVADYAAVRKLADASIVKIAQSIIPNQPWSMSWDPLLAESRVFAESFARA